MRPRHRIELLKTLLTLAGVAFFVLALPCFFVGLMGLSGQLGDTSVRENRVAGLQAIGVGLVPVAIGVVLVVLARRLRVPPNVCPECGYDLSATSDRCPECGAKVKAIDER